MKQAFQNDLSILKRLFHLDSQSQERQLRPHLFGPIDLLQEDINEEESGSKGDVFIERLQWKHWCQVF